MSLQRTVLPALVVVVLQTRQAGNPLRTTSYYCSPTTHFLLLMYASQARAPTAPYFWLHAVYCLILIYVGQMRAPPTTPYCAVHTAHYLLLVYGSEAGGRGGKAKPGGDRKGRKGAVDAALAPAEGTGHPIHTEPSHPTPPHSTPPTLNHSTPRHPNPPYTAPLHQFQTNPDPVNYDVYTPSSKSSPISSLPCLALPTPPHPTHPTLPIPIQPSASAKVVQGAVQGEQPASGRTSKRRRSDQPTTDEQAWGMPGWGGYGGVGCCGGGAGVSAPHGD